MANGYFGAGSSASASARRTSRFSTFQVTQLLLGVTAETTGVVFLIIQTQGGHGLMVRLGDTTETMGVATPRIQSSTMNGRGLAQETRLDAGLNGHTTGCFSR